MPSQTVSGKSFEYALAVELATTFGIDIVGEARDAARRAYDSLTNDERAERHLAAREALDFLSKHDGRIAPGNLVEVEMQPDKVAENGDLRDLVIFTNDEQEIGLSAKNRSRAIRNPRISPENHFGKNWYSVVHSDEYLAAMQLVWDFLAPFQREKKNWPETPVKREKIYSPTISAFNDETRLILAQDAQQRVRRMMAYMLGIADYYMIYKQNGDVAVQSFNMNNTLGWGTSLPKPNRLVEISKKPRSWTTSYMILDEGWHLSFRIHSADNPVKRSLKFEVKILGQPVQFSQHFIKYR